LAYGTHGKPFLASPDDGLDFNLSHSGRWLLFAFARGRAVGVDVESMDRAVDWDAVARRFFSAREQAALQSLPAEQRRGAFFRCWTRKEAYLKATGQGVTLGLSRFAVTLAPGGPAALAWVEEGDPQGWSIADVDPEPGYAGALCAQGAGWQVRCLTAAA
jgi:4'-phosphopantetheinyl transferase